MIKVLLKHLIYEQCIDVMFDGFFRAFKYPEIIGRYSKEKISFCDKELQEEELLSLLDPKDAEEIREALGTSRILWNGQTTHPIPPPLQALDGTEVERLTGGKDDPFEGW